ncbi:hypothetical protein HN662_05515 [Candidatus Woesearchaeota archaeon]|mgnify:CR=1 FL=1|jgi:hypothetical protein|nr:hypothetical protein [Candidatus Woesearchaeota archaeon]
MKRIWHNYSKWEDYQNGMYNTTTKYTEKEQEDMAKKVRDLLSNPELFYKTAKEMINKWSIAAEQNLTIASRNHESWIGQASCSYAHKIPEKITKYGWKLMKVSEQCEANMVAQRVIDEWWSVQDFER